MDPPTSTSFLLESTTCAGFLGGTPKYSTWWHMICKTLTTVSKSDASMFYQSVHCNALQERNKQTNNQTNKQTNKQTIKFDESTEHDDFQSQDPASCFFSKPLGPEIQRPRPNFRLPNAVRPSCLRFPGKRYEEDPGGCGGGLCSGSFCLLDGTRKPTEKPYSCCFF